MYIYIYMYVCTYFYVSSCLLICFLVTCSACSMLCTSSCVYTICCVHTVIFIQHTRIHYACIYIHIYIYTYASKYIHIHTCIDMGLNSFPYYCDVSCTVAVQGQWDGIVQVRTFRIGISLIHGWYKAVSWQAHGLDTLHWDCDYK